MGCNHIGPCGPTCKGFPIPYFPDFPEPRWPWGPTLPPRTAHDWITTNSGSSSMSRRFGIANPLISTNAS